jgi:hypothetical protein
MWPGILKDSHSQGLLKVNILRDSHKPFLTPNQEFERQFGGKTVLAGLRLKSRKKHFLSLKFVLIYFHLFSSFMSADFQLSAPVAVRPTRPRQILKRNKKSADIKRLS